MSSGPSALRPAPETLGNLAVRADKVPAAASIPTGLEALAGPELSVIVPTFNECGNVRELVARLKISLQDIAWEVVIVDDDSPDGTAETARELALEDHRVRVVQRIGRRGLASACVEGMLSTSAPYLAVIDGDLQHDEQLLPRMLAVLREGETDIVVGSRYASEGGVEGWDPGRVRISRLATRISRLLVPQNLTDPMSGFFMLRREVFTASVRRLSNLGFKILTDLFAASPHPLRFKELSYTFASRHSGESKFDSASAWDFLLLVLDKLVGRWIPVRFLSFCLVGAVGVAVHFAVLSTAFKALGKTFLVSQALATVCAMTFNFTVNNLLTYRDRRLRGIRWLGGWLSFNLVCSVGAMMNVGLAGTLYKTDYRWSVAAFAGIVVGAVWNYFATTALTWGRPRK